MTDNEPFGPILTSFPGIERIDHRFLHEQKMNSNVNLTAEAFYTADFSAQWWGILNGLVADKALFKNLPERVRERMEENAPIVALLEGTGGMGKTTTARRLAAELHEEFEVYWIDEIGGDDLEAGLSTFIETQRRQQHQTLVIVDDWGKFSYRLQERLLMEFRKQLRLPNGGQIRYVITSREFDHHQLSHELLHPDARIRFDGDKNLQDDNKALIDRALNFFDARFVGLADSVFNKEDRLVGKPFHLLIILLRAAQDEDLRILLSKLTRNAEGKFREIIQYDFDKLYRDEEDRGLAVALLFYAWLRIKHSTSFSKIAFFQLANLYSISRVSTPAQRLVASPADQWGILSHYLTLAKKSIKSQEGSVEIISFKKDEYWENIVKLELSPGRSVADFLAKEQRSIVEFIIDGYCTYSSSLAARIYSTNEPIFTEEQQVELIEKLLSKKNNYYAYTSVFLSPGRLQKVSFDKKWEWSVRMNTIAPDSAGFYTLFLKFIKAETKDWLVFVRALVEAGAMAANILLEYFKNLPEGSRADIVRNVIERSNSAEVQHICLKMLSKEPDIKEIARNLLIHSVSSEIKCACLKILSNEADIKEIIETLLAEENVHAEVQCACLKLLTHIDKENAKQNARLILPQSRYKDVICMCLNLLSREPETKEIARALLHQFKDTEIIYVCLNILSFEPDIQEIVIEIIEGSKSAEIHRICLSYLKEEKVIEEIAGRMLEETKSNDVIRTCLNLLYHVSDKTAVKARARMLLSETTSDQLKCTCLHLLKNEPDAKEKAWKFLRTSNSIAVKCVCLNMLSDEPEAKAEAREMLHESKATEILCICLNILSDEPETRERAKQLLETTKSPEVQCRCLYVLQKQNDLEYAAAFALNAIRHWENTNPKLIGNCLNYLPTHPDSEALITKVLTERNKSDTIYRYIIQLGPGKHDLWKQKVRESIKYWRSNHTEMVGHCMLHLEDEPILLQGCCQQILENWMDELDRIRVNRRRKKDLNISDFYIIKALSHPFLTQLARRTARDMHEEEQFQPNYLTPELLEVVNNFADFGSLPDWKSDDKEKEPLFLL